MILIINYCIFHWSFMTNHNTSRDAGSGVVMAIACPPPAFSFVLSFNGNFFHLPQATGHRKQQNFWFDLKRSHFGVYSKEYRQT